MDTGFQHAHGFGVLQGGNRSPFIEKAGDIVLTGGLVSKHEDAATSALPPNINEWILAAAEIRREGEVVSFEVIGIALECHWGSALVIQLGFDSLGALPLT